MANLPSPFSPVLVLAVWTAALSASSQSARPTIREALASVVVDIELDSNVLDAPVPTPPTGRRFALVRQHLNPSAERTFVFSAAGKFIRVLDGWELATLSNDVIVYRHSQVHFAPTHTVVLSVFDPVSISDRQIYPPQTVSEVRRDFIARVQQAYEDRGADWFRAHNHHMDAEQFDTALAGRLGVDGGQGTLSFVVRFGDPDNAHDPVPFSQRVDVRCSPLRFADINCRESAAR